MNLPEFLDHLKEYHDIQNIFRAMSAPNILQTEFDRTSTYADFVEKLNTHGNLFILDKYETTRTIKEEEENKDRFDNTTYKAKTIKYRNDLYKKLEEDLKKHKKSLKDLKEPLSNIISNYLNNFDDDFENYIKIDILKDAFFKTVKSPDSYEELKRYIINNFNNHKLDFPVYEQIKSYGDYINYKKIIFTAVKIFESKYDTKPLDIILKYPDTKIAIKDYQDTPLIHICRKKETIEYLLTKCVNQQDKEDFVNPKEDSENPKEIGKRTVLYHFTYDQNDIDFGILKLLLENGANPNIDKNGDIKQQSTTDSFAKKIILNADIDTIKFVLNNEKIKLNIKETGSGNTLFHFAIEKNYPEIVEILIQKIPDMINEVNNKGLTPLLYAMQTNADHKIIKTLLDNGADPNIADKDDKTPLFFINNAESLDYFLNNKNVDFLHTDSVGKNFLFYIKDDEKIIKKLSDNIDRLPKESFKGVERYKENFLHWVQNINLCKIYVEAVGNNAKEIINQKNIRGNTPLHWARTPEIAEYLIKNGADVNAENDSLATPLHLANNEDIANVLIKYGADENKKDEMDKTPKDYWDIYWE